ncbi:MAG: cation:proton antiporter [Acidobacteriota bacterium]
MHHATSVIAIAAAAFILPLLASRLRISAVTLEIAFGILAGPALLRLISRSELLDFLAEFGFLLLMFLSGFEIDFGKLERKGPLQLILAAAIFALTLTLSYWAAHALGYGAFVTFLLATTSVGLVVPTLRNARLAATPFGQLVLISALLADFLTMLGVTTFALIHEHGFGWSLLGIPALLIVTAAILVILKRVAWWYPEWFDRLFSANDPQELGIRASLALMFIIVGLSYALEVEPILGAFLAGTVFALVFRHRGLLEQQLAGFSYGFLIPVFFINVGLSFDLKALLEPGVMLRALALLLAAVAVKLIPSLLLVVRSFTLREAVAAGVLLSARLSLVIAVAALGVRLGLLDQGLRASVIVLAMVTSTFAPTLFRLLAPAPPASAPSRLNNLEYSSRTH